MEKIKNIRKATHSGSWYEKNKEKLDNILQNFLSNSNSFDLKDHKIKGLIGPHAGYDYSGPTSAWGYININPSEYSRVFLLGPSHHLYLNTCGLPYFEVYETPLGNIEIDLTIVDELKKDKNFITLRKSDEEKEHSLEMHLPFIRKIFGDNNFKLIPIMVGHLEKEQQIYYGKVFSEYLKDEKNLFIISSDFCHWGKDFDYQPIKGDIKQSSSYIEELDKKGIDLMVDQNPEDFDKYLSETKNTICGSTPILTYLYGLKFSGLRTKTNLVNYSQSSKVKTKRDSSVSYASILTYCE